MCSELGNLTSTVYSTPTILLNVQPGASEAKTIYFLHFVTCFRLKVLFSLQAIVTDTWHG